MSVAEKKILQWDNFTHVLSLLAMVIMAALFQTLFRDGYYITAIDRRPYRAALVDLYNRFRPRSVAIALLFFAIIWLVKLASLLCYGTIFGLDKNFGKAW